MIPESQIDFAIRQFLHKRFVPRPGVDRVGRRFPVTAMPVEYGREGELTCAAAQSLFVNRCFVKYANPCDDVYEVETENHKRAGVRMEWLRLYWQEAGR